MVPPADPAACARTRELAPKQLGDDAFAVALQVGRSLSLSDAITVIMTPAQDVATG